MTHKDYKEYLSSYRNDLLTKEMFLDKQVASWKATENFVQHHFSKTVIFLCLFLFGGLSYFLLVSGTHLQETGEKFFGGLLICLIFVVVAVCSFLVRQFQKHLGAMIYQAFILDGITKDAYLEEIDRHESSLHRQLGSLAFTIRYHVKDLNSCDPCDINKIKQLSDNLTEFSDMLTDMQKSLDALHSIRNEYYHDNLFDLDIINNVCRHRR